MIRRLSTLACAVSLVLCIATIWMWVRSRSRMEGFEVVTGGGTLWQFWSTSQLGIGHVSHWPEPSGTHHPHYRIDQGPPTIADHSITLFINSTIPGTRAIGTKLFGAGFSHGEGRVRVTTTGDVLRMPPWPDNILMGPFSPPLPFWEIYVPHWLAVTLFGLFPFLVIFRRTRVGLIVRRRRRQSCCLRCGYDLRATPGRCPECGAAVNDKHVTV